MLEDRQKDDNKMIQDGGNRHAASGLKESSGDRWRDNGGELKTWKIVKNIHDCNEK